VNPAGPTGPTDYFGLVGYRRGVTIPGLDLPPENHGVGSLRTVVTAAAANFGIAVAKGAAAAVTGSVVLLAEAMHSVADTGTEVLLFVGLRKSGKPEDDQHPFGYGQERYFWAFLASLAIFLIGGVLSIVEGLGSLVRSEPLTSPWIAGAVLLLAAAFEAYSWRTARRQLVADARRRQRSLVEHLRRVSDPSAPTVYLEDSAALIGIALAAAGLIGHLLSGWGGSEGLASIAIGLLLIAVAVLLARRSKALLIDESVPLDVLEPIRAEVGRTDWVSEVGRLDAIFVGPSQLLLVVTVVPVSAVMAADGHDLARHVQSLRQRLQDSPAVTEVAVTVCEAATGQPAPDRQ
jgi:cation diffusion facilitator family transporter